MRPFIKWPGGKSGVFEKIAQHFPPRKYETYVEPFVGAGGGLLKAATSGLFKRFVANDDCGELINALKQTVYEPELVLALLDKLFQRHSRAPETSYYTERNTFNEQLGVETVEQAARFIYLNHTCFNGLYRTNKNGKFNVPFGKRKGAFDSKNLEKAAQTLKSVWFAHGDFEKIECFVDNNTLVYVDPPYIPLKGDAERLYGAEFGEEEQLRTARFCRRLLERGASVIASNSDASNVGGTNNFLLDAYKGFKVVTIEAPRRIGASGESRKTVTELLFIGEP